MTIGIGILGVALVATLSDYDGGRVKSFAKVVCDPDVAATRVGVASMHAAS